MNDLVITQVEKETEAKIQTMSFGWMDNFSIQKLLDVVVSIIVEEYIQIVKQNPGVFLEQGETK